jgi:hypothetical protein
LTLTICHPRPRFLKVEIHHPENSLYAHTLFLGRRQPQSRLLRQLLWYLPFSSGREEVKEVMDLD